MSDFLANLNASPTQSESKDDFSQLDLFANTDFLNFDLLEPMPSNADFEQTPDSAKDNLRSWNNMGPSEILNSESCRLYLSPIVLHKAALLGCTGNLHGVHACCGVEKATNAHLATFKIAHGPNTMYR
jgi:hypothetical protein